MKKTLYVSDLDGTLLQSDAGLTDFARESLNRMIGEGLLFSVASGRQLLSIQDVLTGLNIKLPIIEKDGAFVSDLHSGVHYSRQDIPRETAVAILDKIHAAGLSPFLNTTDGQQDKLCYQTVQNEGARWYLERRQFLNDPRLTFMDLETAVHNEHTVGFIVIGAEAELENVFSELMIQYPDQLSGYVQENHYSPGWYWLAIHHEASQKDRGIAKMRQMMGLEDVELVVFGDQLNDLPMILAADRGIGMGNGDTAVKQAADLIIGPNSADSVVKFILAEWEGRDGVVE